jgi:hypothetical protein
MGFRISLRELLVLVALLAVAFVLLKFASPLTAVIVASIAMIVCGAMAVMAFVERGSRQAFAIGFTVIAVAFFYSLNSQGIGNPYNVFPAERALTFLHRHLATRWIHDSITGERLRPVLPTELEAGSSQPSRAELMDNPDLFVSRSAPFGAQSPPTNVLYHPSIRHFISVGNSLLTLLFAYLGGKLAVWIYHRRVARECDNAKASSDEA